MTDKVLYQQDGHVVTLTINMPETRNAITDQDVADIFIGHCARLQSDLSVRAVIVTGAGLAFSSGGKWLYLLSQAADAKGSVQIVSVDRRATNQSPWISAAEPAAGRDMFISSPSIKYLSIISDTDTGISNINSLIFILLFFYGQLKYEFTAFVFFAFNMYCTAMQLNKVFNQE